MIAGKDFYQVLSALVPLYLTMGLAYASVRRWKIFTAEQCAGINRFVAVFAVPFLSFTFVAQNNLYQMNYRFIAADTLQKTSLLAFLLLLSKTPLPFRRRRRQTISSIDWTITLFSLSTLPNTLVVGIPLLAAMYGGFTSPLMVQIVVFQGVVWNTVLLALFEYRAALLFIADQFPVSGTAARISSVRVESDVVSLQTSSAVGASVAEIDERGNLHVLVARKSAATDSSRFSISSARLMEMINKNNKNLPAGANPARKSGGPPRASDLTGVEIWSARTSPRNSSFVGEDDNGGNRSNVVGGRRSLRHEKHGLRPPPPSPQLLHMFSWSGMNNTASFPGYYCRNNLNDNGYIGKMNNQAWSSGDINSAAEAAESLRTNGDSDHIAGDHRRTKSTDVEKEDQPEEGDEEEEEEKKGMAPPAGVMTRLVLLMVWKKLVRNPNSYASLFGVVWSLVAFRWDLTLPAAVVKNSVSILANTGLGMAMFSLGLFMALQPKLIACGKWMALMAMATRFLLGPGVAAAAALAVGIRGVLLRVMIVQAALPQGILPFVFAKEYNLHPDILSTAVIFGMVLALPITIIYYVVLGL